MLTFRALALRQSLLRSANARNVSFETTLYGGQFVLAIQSIILNHLNILFHRCSTTVSFETYFPEVLGYTFKTKSDEFPFVVSIMTS